MTDDDNKTDDRDPFVVALDEYRRTRAPKDVVPKEPWPIDQNADLEALAGTDADFIAYEDTDTGYRRTITRAGIAAPYYGRKDTHD
jgi:hypothetical protein